MLFLTLKSADKAGIEHFQPANIQRNKVGRYDKQEQDSFDTIPSSRLDRDRPAAIDCYRF